MGPRRTLRKPQTDDYADLMVRARLYAAWTLLIGSLIGWPLSQLTVANDEPPFTLALSWLAITLTAADLLSTTDVRNQEQDQAEARKSPGQRR